MLLKAKKATLIIESKSPKSSFILFLKRVFAPKKILISMIFAFIFWMPFFGVILQNLALESNTIFYKFLEYFISIFLIFASFSIAVISYKNANFLKFKLGLSHYSNSLDSINNQSFLTIFKDSIKNCKIYIFYFLSILFFIILFSILHKNHYFLSSVSYIVSIAIFLFLPKKFRFLFGFFVGIFGFYWIPFSFRFENLEILIPFAIIGIGLIYGVIFYFLLYYKNPFFRILSCLCLFFIAPFSFNWLNLAYFSAYTIFSTSSLLLILLSIVSFKKRYYILSFAFFLISLEWDFNVLDSKLNASIVETNYSQFDKWSVNHRDEMIENNFKAIENAINAGFDMVILPESAFPLTLNKNAEIYKKLLDLSQKIVIITGALRVQSDFRENKNSLYLDNEGVIMLDNFKKNEVIESSNLDSAFDFIDNSYINVPSKASGYYNSTYIFAFGRSIVADKIELVPFGERLPFDSIFRYFGIDFGFKSGTEVVKFEYKGLKIAIANCFEGTMDLPYKSGAKYIIMGSNNAWFSPSSEPLMQQMIIKYYARAYKVFVYHATNASKKAIITPTPLS